MKKRILAAALAATLSVTMLSGCGKTETASSTETSSAAEETTEETDSSEGLREVNVVLDWYPNAIHAFLYTAIERGYFKEEGLDVQIRFPSNASDALSLVAAGKAEIGMYYQHDVIQAIANQKTPVKAIGAIVQSPLCVILSLKDKNITGPEDLAGKTIGYGGTALSEAFIKCMIENVGADSSDVNMVDVGFDLMSSMTTGNVDATIGCLVNHEVPQMEEEGFDVNYFMVNGYGSTAGSGHEPEESYCIYQRTAAGSGHQLRWYLCGGSSYESGNDTRGLWRWLSESTVRKRPGSDPGMSGADSGPCLYGSVYGGCIRHSGCPGRGCGHADWFRRRL